MIPCDHPQFNRSFKHPDDLAESQCQTIRAYVGPVNGGSVDGVPMVVTAWKPSVTDLARLRLGDPVFITFIGASLPPHLVSTTFHEATHPA